MSHAKKGGFLDLEFRKLFYSIFKFLGNLFKFKAKKV
jgi:hypothetical protein